MLMYIYTKIQSNVFYTLFIKILYKYIMYLPLKTGFQLPLKFTCNVYF